MTKLNLITPIKALANSVVSAEKAADKTRDNRHTLAACLAAEFIEGNLNTKLDYDEVSLLISKEYPKGSGKEADPTQKKQVQACRQVISTFKKGSQMDQPVWPADFDTYSQYRKAIYDDQDKTPIEKIENWINKDAVSIKDIEALLLTYKALAIAA